MGIIKYKLSSLAFIIAAIIFTSNSLAEESKDLDLLFEKSKKDYLKQNFENAAQGFQKLVDLKNEKASPSELYNLGNSYFMLKNYAKSYAYYKLALNKNPGFKNAKENLSIANEKLGGVNQIKVLSNENSTEALGLNKNFIVLTTSKLVNYLGKSKLFFLCLISYLAFCTLLYSLYENSSSSRKISFTFSAIFSLFFAFLYLFSTPTSRGFLELSFNLSNTSFIPAVVITNETEVFSNKNENSPVLALLSAGEEIPALHNSDNTISSLSNNNSSLNTNDSANDWIRLKLPGSRYGWAKKEELVLIQ